MSIRDKCKPRNEHRKAGPARPIFLAWKPTKLFSERRLFGGNVMAWPGKRACPQLWWPLELSSALHILVVVHPHTSGEHTDRVMFGKKYLCVSPRQALAKQPRMTSNSSPSCLQSAWITDKVYYTWLEVHLHDNSSLGEALGWCWLTRGGHQKCKVNLPSTLNATTSLLLFFLLFFSVMK